jgi:SAM-dependent methyltransferase
MSDPRAVVEHYGADPLLSRIDEALRTAGLGDGIIDWSDLTPLDQFHVRGLGATRELAEALGVAAGEKVLDVGCGLGGPARFLAATYGCHVTGVDISQSFVDAARMLTERAGLAGRADFLRADALDLPFDDSSFGHAWTQHVAMNIADRGRFYGSIHRVLKPGGRLAIYDVVAGDGGPPIFPLPWARAPEISFLLTPEAMRDALGRAGFTEVSWDDKTDEGLAWAAETRAGVPSSPPPLGLHVAMGPGFAAMAANLGRSLQEGRVRLIQAIVTKAPAS